MKRETLNPTELGQKLLESVQEWEQGRRKPSGPAEALIKIAFRHPEVFLQDLT